LLIILISKSEARAWKAEKPQENSRTMNIRHTNLVSKMGVLIAVDTTLRSRSFHPHNIVREIKTAGPESPRNPLPINPYKSLA
jgi:hypothetical protein